MSTEIAAAVATSSPPPSCTSESYLQASRRAFELQTFENSVNLNDGTTGFAALAWFSIAELRRYPETFVAMISSSTERRVMRRFDMRLPASVRLMPEDPELLTETQNVSARGIFFYLDRPVEPGATLSVTLTFPPHVTLTDSVRVRFTARVIRVDEPLPASRVGIAAMIEKYDFLGSDSAEPTKKAG